jgi:hypothetical protein
MNFNERIVAMRIRGIAASPRRPALASVDVFELAHSIPELVPLCFGDVMNLLANPLLQPIRRAILHSDRGPPLTNFSAGNSNSVSTSLNLEAPLTARPRRSERKLHTNSKQYFHIHKKRLVSKRGTALHGP